MDRKKVIKLFGGFFGGDAHLYDFVEGGERSFHGACSDSKNNNGDN